MTVELEDPSEARMPENTTMLNEYANSMRRFTNVISSAGADVAAVRVPACPAWNVQNLLSHLTAVAANIASGGVIGPDVQAWVDREIAARAERTVTSLIDEWEDQLPRLETVLKGRSIGGLIIDTITHEHDLYGALGPAATDHGQGLYAVLPAIIEHVRGLSPLGEKPGLRLRSNSSECTFGGEEIGLEVTVPDDWELFRLLACRRSATQLKAYPQSGDGTLLFDLVSRYPLPERPLDN